MANYYEGKPENLENHIIKYKEFIKFLYDYKIIAKGSPVLGFTESTKDGDKMQLLAIRQICLTCLDTIVTKNGSLEKLEKKPNFRTQNSIIIEDEFENYIAKANESLLEILKLKLMDGIDTINSLLKNLRNHSI